MKTSNIILTVATVAAIAFTTVQVIGSVRKIKEAREALRPAMEALDSTEIKVIKMVCGNYNYIANDHATPGQHNLIRFPHSTPSADAVKVVGDTLIITTEDRVVISIPTATHIVEWNGEVTELKNCQTSND